MDTEIIKKIDDLLEVFENSHEIKKIESLKKQIYNNYEIKEKIDKLNKLKNNIYSNEFIEVKKEILEIKEIKEYKRLENDLFLLILSINQKLNSLINSRGCKNENN